MAKKTHPKTMCEKTNDKVRKRFATYYISKGLISLTCNKLLKNKEKAQ